MPELVIGGIALVPVIVTIVQILKRLGLPADYAPVANGLLTVVAYLLMLWTQTAPQYESYVVLGLQILVLFLTSAGLYTTGKWAAEQAGLIQKK